jgi:hypothetical protein
MRRETWGRGERERGREEATEREGRRARESEGRRRLRGRECV